MKYSKEILNRLLKGFEHSERVTEVPFVLDSLPEPPGTLLDVGCKENILPIVLKGAGFDVWAVDKRPYEHQFEQFVKAEARQLPFEDNSFDIVTCVSTLEHIGLVGMPYYVDTVYEENGDIIAFLQMLRVTKMGGSIIITLPYGLGHKGMSHWIRFYNKERLDRMFPKDNFIINKMQFYRYTGKEDDQWLIIGQDEAEMTPSEPNKVVCNMGIMGCKIK